MVELLTSVAGLGGGLAVTICVIAVDFRRMRTAVKHYVSAVMDYFGTTLLILTSHFG
jgi:hypothetical protein